MYKSVVRQNIYEEIVQERDRQDRKFGHQKHADHIWLSLVVEEVGEVAECLNDGMNKGLVRTELVQVAALVVAWLEKLREDEYEGKNINDTF